MIEFGPFTLDAARYELRRDGRLLAVERRAFDALLYLIQRREHVVSREELLEHVWRGVSVSLNSITRVAAVLRKLLDDDDRHPIWIATIHGRGYRFVGALRDPSSGDDGLPVAQEPIDYRRMVVGRRMEKEWLSAAMVDARAGRSSLLLLEGEAGIGKSRLLEWCAEEAARHSLQPILGHCREDDGAPALWPWIQVMRRLQALLPPDARALLLRSAPLLAHLFPDIGALASMRAAAVVETDPRPLRFQAYTALADVLREASRRRPMALLFDDLHRADASSIALLDFLATQLADSGIVFAASLRPVGGDRDGLARLARDARCRTLSLKGLVESDVFELLLAAMPEASSKELAHEIWEQTGGNAFFVHQIIPLAARLTSAKGGGTSIARALPSTVRKAIEQQCAALSAVSLAALRAGAVIGRELSAELLAEVLQQPLEATLDALDEAQRANVLERCSESVLRYRFGHLLVRDVLYEELGSNERATLHARVGAALEALHPDAPQLASELAHHFWAAGTRLCVEKSIRYHRVAGDFAAARFAYPTAMTHYRTALQLLDASPDADPQQRCDLLTTLARQTFYAGFSQNATKLWIEAADQARAIEDPSRFIRVVLDFSAGLDGSIQSVPAEKTTPLLEEAVGLSASCTPIEHARLLARQAQSLELAGHPAAAERVSESALALARDTADPLATAEALTFGVLRRIGTPETAARAEVAAEVVDHAERAANRSMQFAYLAKRISALAELGRFDEADRVIERYGRLAEDLRSPVDVAIWCQFRAMRALMQGHWSDARPLIERARELARHCEPALFHDLGAISAGLEIETAGFNPRTLQLIDHGNASGWGVIRLYAYRELERPDLIEREIDATISDLMRVRSRSWLHVAMPLAQVICYIKDQARGAAVLEWFRGFESLHVISNVYLGPVPLAVGTLYRTLREWDRAIECLDTALRMVLDVGSHPFEGRVRVQLAASHAGRSQREDIAAARIHAAAALRLAEQLGMPSLDREARRMLERLGSA